MINRTPNSITSYRADKNSSKRCLGYPKNFLKSNDQDIFVSVGEINSIHVQPLGRFFMITYVEYQYSKQIRININY